MSRLLIAIVEFVLSLPLFFAFNTKTAEMQFVEDYWWVQSYGISYKLGIDGISLLLVLLTTFLTVLCILSSWKAITQRVKEYMISFLFLETGMVGALVSLDLDPLLCLLGGDAHPHVSSHRGLGKPSRGGSMRRSNFSSLRWREAC